MPRPPQRPYSAGQLVAQLIGTFRGHPAGCTCFDCHFIEAGTNTLTTAVDAAATLAQMAPPPATVANAIRQRLPRRAEKGAPVAAKAPRILKAEPPSAVETPCEIWDEKQGRWVSTDR